MENQQPTSNPLPVFSPQPELLKDSPQVSYYLPVLGVVFLISVSMAGAMGYYFGQKSALRQLEPSQLASVPTAIPVEKKVVVPATPEIIVATPSVETSLAPTVDQLAGQTTPSISTGIYGKVKSSTAACMMPVNPPAEGCKNGPAQVEIVVTKANLSGADKYFSDVKLQPAEILFTTTSNDQGFFQFELPAGEYRYFIRANNKASCPEGGSDPCHVVLKSGELKNTELNVMYDNGN